MHWAPVLTLSITVLTSTVSITAAAADRDDLALVLKQLDAVEQISQRLDQQALPSSSSRYTFDDQRLRADIQRIRTGIEAYLTPVRAQPADLDDLDGEYNHEVSP